MRICGLLLVATTLGCWQIPTFGEVEPSVDAAISDASRKDATSHATDTGSLADTSLVETSVVDTGSDSLAPYTCQSPLPPSFACSEIPHTKGMRVCTDAMIAEFVSCFGAGDPVRCNAAQKNYPECSACILEKWIIVSSAGVGVVDTPSCIQLRDPDGACGRITRCNTDCLEAVCGDCDSTAGTGRTSARSELDDCYADARFAGSPAKAKGACYDLASKDAVACSMIEDLAPCFLHTADDLTTFYRGACRDGGDWSATGPAADAGTDAAADGSD
jgi:hypothetical protein